MTNRILVTLMFHSPNLSDEHLQSEVQGLVLQLQGCDGVEDADFIPVEMAPPGTKSMDGGFVLGALKVLIENSNILKGLLTVGNALMGNGTTLKINVKAANGEEFSGEAGNVAELEKIRQQAEIFLKERDKDEQE
jgi:hypothetical protein